MKPRGFFQLAVVIEGGMGVVALFLSFLCGLNLWSGAGFDTHAVVWIIAATFFLVACYFAFKILPLECLKRIDQIVRDFYRENMVGLAVWQVAVIAAVAGFGEELLFRGFLQSGLLTWIGNDFYPTAAVVFGVSLLFAIGHAVTKTYFILAFLVSVYFGVLLLQTENILVPITVHALYDLFVLLYIRGSDEVQS